MKRSAILRNLMTEKGMKVSDIAKESGLAYSTVKSILENGTEKAGYINVYKICLALGITADELEQMVNGENAADVRLDCQDQEFIKKYNSLDAVGRRHIDIVLEWEAERTDYLLNDSPLSLHSAPNNTTRRLKAYSYMLNITRAGTGFYFDDIPSDTIKAPYVEGADFIIGINGNSMEPDYHDDDKLYIKKAERLAPDDIGVFADGRGFCLKKLGPEGLVSGNDNVCLIGKVIGKVNNTNFPHHLV